jgi:ArsR family transcriptional regulator
MNKRRFLQITRALADERRFEILERIAAVKGDISCIDLRAKIPISRATLSHHIKELATAGLIEKRRESKYMFLRMRQKTWNQYMKRLGKITPGKFSHA